MDVIRSRKLVLDTLKRDKGICVCCGFNGNQVHHIKPIIYGGEDSLDNMVTICEICHKYAPDDLKEFNKYKNLGGMMSKLLLGDVGYYSLVNDIDFKETYNKFKLVIDDLKLICKKYGENKYG